MDAGDLPICPTCRERFGAMLHDLDERLLIAEAILGRPMSIADRLIAEAAAKRRYEERFGSEGLLTALE
jgi:hypothetical protein